MTHSAKALSPHLVESAQSDDDVGKRFLAEGRELSECRQPRHRRVRRPSDDIVSEQSAQINRPATGLGLERLQ
jgi:hypothetical protein